MPISALKPCSHPGCHAVTTNRYCEAHKDDAKPWKHPFRQSARERGYGTPEHRAWRKAVMQRDPICKACGIRPSTEADHIIPKSRGGKDTLDNGQGLCHKCHSAKTSREKAESRS